LTQNFVLSQALYGTVQRQQLQMLAGAYIRKI
jgi:hypothetical protein